MRSLTTCLSPLFVETLAVSYPVKTSFIFIAESYASVFQFHVQLIEYLPITLGTRRCIYDIMFTTSSN